MIDGRQLASWGTLGFLFACSRPESLRTIPVAGEPAPIAVPASPSAAAPTSSVAAPTASASAAVGSAAPNAKRTIPEAELFAPRPGEKLCTIVKRSSKATTWPEVRQFEDARGFIVRTLSTSGQGTSSSRSTMLTITYADNGNVLRVERDDEPDGTADIWTQYEYDADGVLKGFVEEETPDQKGAAYKVSIKGKLSGSRQTTGMIDVPDRFLTDEPVAVPPSRLPFEGKMYISLIPRGDAPPGASTTYEFDKRGLLIKRTGFVAGGEGPYSEDKYVYDGAGRKAGKGTRYANGRLVRRSAPQYEHVDEVFEYDKDGSLKAIKVVDTNDGTVAEEYVIERLCP